MKSDTITNEIGKKNNNKLQNPQYSFPASYKMNKMDKLSKL